MVVRGEGTVASGTDRVTSGPPASTTSLQAAFRALRALGAGPLAAVDPAGRVVVADPELACVLGARTGEDGVADLAVRLAAALGDGPAVTVRPVRHDGRLRGVLVAAADLVQVPWTFRLVGLHGDHSVLVSPGEVRLAEVDGPTVWLATERGRLRCAERGLTRLERRLDPYGFLRVHRHYLVNLRRVREVAPTFRGGMVLVLDGPERQVVPVSRRRVAQVRTRLCL